MDLSYSFLQNMSRRRRSDCNNVSSRTPASLQHPVVEYKNDDEYGRLIRPCLCRGGMRYIHELCLMNSRTLGVRPRSLWVCDTCGYEFNFRRLKIQKILASRGSSLVLTVLVLVIMLFVLGFVADPIINLYIDPYDTLTRHEYWQHVEVREIGTGKSWWFQHFAKGFVSMGVVGFVKTMILNPWQWINWRNSGMGGAGSRTGTTGRDRAVNISWIAVLIGVGSAIYLFYQWVQTIAKRSLQYVGNHIVDTQLPGDDDDIKPPPGWQPEASAHSAMEPDSVPRSEEQVHQPPSLTKENEQKMSSAHEDPPENDYIFVSALAPDEPVALRPGPGHESHAALDGAHRQGWSFDNI